MKIRKLILILLLTVNLAGCIGTQSHGTPEDEPAPESKAELGEEGNLEETAQKELPDDQKVRIACIGNSITQGSHLENPTTEAYPSRLREMLSSVYGDTCIVKNYGLSGRTMLKNGPNPIWKEDKFREALNWKPDICFILLGTNDSRPDLWKRSGKEFLEDYLAMIDSFKTRNPDTRFIIGLPTPIFEGHSYGGNTWGEKHNDSIMVHGVIPLINQVAERTDAVLLDFHTAFRDSLQLFPDRLHPNRTGANHLARMIFETITEEELVHEVIKSKADQ